MRSTKSPPSKSTPKSNLKQDLKNKLRVKFKRDWTEYGGELRKTRKGRASARPLSYRQTMHLVLRATKAKGEWSFRKPKHQKNIRRIVEKFAVMYDVHLLSMANVGNHLHLHLKLESRVAYRAFIRATAGAIAMTVTGVSRWNKKQGSIGSVRAKTQAGSAKTKFWDHRPYSRIVLSLKHFLNLKDYVAENQLEGQGVGRHIAWLIVELERDQYGNPANFGS